MGSNEMKFHYEEKNDIVLTLNPTTYIIKILGLY